MPHFDIPDGPSRPAASPLRGRAVVEAGGDASTNVAKRGAIAFGASSRRLEGTGSAEAPDETVAPLAELGFDRAFEATAVSSEAPPIVSQVASAPPTQTGAEAAWAPRIAPTSAPAMSPAPDVSAGHASETSEIAVPPQRATRFGSAETLVAAPERTLAAPAAMPREPGRDGTVPVAARVTAPTSWGREAATAPREAPQAPGRIPPDVEASASSPATRLVGDVATTRQGPAADLSRTAAAPVAQRPDPVHSADVQPSLPRTAGAAVQDARLVAEAVPNRAETSEPREARTPPLAAATTAVATQFAAAPVSARPGLLETVRPGATSPTEQRAGRARAERGEPVGVQPADFATAPPLRAASAPLAYSGPVVAQGGPAGAAAATVQPNGSVASGREQAIAGDPTGEIRGGETGVPASVAQATPGSSAPQLSTVAPGVASAPPAAQAVAEQAVRLARRDTPGEVEIRLDPPELGRVRLSLSRQDHALVVSVVAERPEVVDLLRRHADMLGQSLADAGHSRVDLQFGRGGGQGHGAGGDSGLPGELVSDDASPSLSPPAAGTRGLDLRV